MLRRPFGIEFDPDGNLYISDTHQQPHREGDAMKTFATLATLALLAARRARRPAASDDEPRATADVVGNICTIAGNGENGYAGDATGPALEAKMSLPQDTLTASDGTLYILDWNNHRIRELDPDGTIRHVAGRGELGGTLDDPANSDFNHPTGMRLRRRRAAAS